MPHVAWGVQGPAGRAADAVHADTPGAIGAVTGLTTLDVQVRAERDTRSRAGVVARS
jgi:hypothetical protein